MPVLGSSGAGDEELARRRDTLYAERQAHRINDETLRAMVSELDMSEVALRKRLVVARRAAGLPPLPHAGGAH